ncbi:adenine deaminase [bacterium]|nr:MAG: adenine deaminase [bacterium]
MNTEELTRFIKTARGECPADIVLKGANIVNILSGEIYEADVAIMGDRIAGIGEYEGKEIVELNGGYLVPGLIDAHVHIESSMVAPPQYARGVLPRGTTAVFADPHEIANVMGKEGVRLMLNLSEGLPLSVFIMVPSCVPSTDMETAGAELTADDISQLLIENRVAGLAEMMNFPGVIFGVPEVLAKLGAASGRVIDGHAPGLSGKDLQAYAGTGIASDHECTTPEEAVEKLRAGMNIMIRESTGARNLDALLPMVTPENSRRIMFASDDLHPPELLNRGHIDYMVRRAIEFGIEPITAIRMGSLNAAEYFRKYDMGAIAPGKLANIIWLPDIKKFEPQKVWAKGRLAAENGKIIPNELYEKKISTPMTVNPAPFDSGNFKIPAQPSAKAHIIQLITGQIVTEHIVDEIKVENRFAVADIEHDTLILAVIERHKATGNIGLGFVRGFGLRNGALASSVGHDSHNITVVGTNEIDMNVAAKAVVEMGGGFVAAATEKIIGKLPLPLAGLMSTVSIDDVNAETESLKKVAAQLGSKVEDPFMLLGFLALPVIPKLKLTDKGLVDVEQFKIINLFE